MSPIDSTNQEDSSGNPNMQLGGLLAPMPAEDGVQIVEEVLSHRVEDGRVLIECWTSGGEWATVVLTPVDGVRLSGNATAALPNQPKGVVQLTGPDGKTIQAKFD